MRKHEQHITLNIHSNRIRKCQSVLYVDNKKMNQINIKCMLRQKENPFLNQICTLKLVSYTECKNNNTGCTQKSNAAIPEHYVISRTHPIGIKLKNNSKNIQSNKCQYRQYKISLCRQCFFVLI